MTIPATEPIWLTRRDPVRNMARFYVLTLQPTLFGEVSLLRNWGRIGSKGQVLHETFGDGEIANAALRKIERRKRQKGYRGNVPTDEVNEACSPDQDDPRRIGCNQVPDCGKRKRLVAADRLRHPLPAETLQPSCPRAMVLQWSTISGEP